MKIRPLQDRIIVKRLEEETKTKGGIIIPDTAKEKPIEGKVVAVGKGKKTDDGKLIALDVKVGDKVLFSKYGGTEVKIDGEEYLIMREDDILGVIENMSYYICPNCNEKINIFGKSKIDETAAELGVPVLAKLPINPEINVLVDEGRISEIEANELDDFVELLK